MKKGGGKLFKRLIRVNIHSKFLGSFSREIFLEKFERKEA